MDNAALGFRRSLALAAVLSVASAWAQGQAAQPTAATPTTAAAGAFSAPAEKLERDGLPNLGCIGQHLCRSGQPEAKGYDALKNFGVAIVVNLRDNPKKDEREQVESRGMRYVHIPWNAFDRPDNGQVAEFLHLLRANPEKKILVHCRRGAERTGVMIAAFRIAEQGWTAEQALDEMEDFKFRGFWFRHLKNYVRRFPALLTSEPALQSLQPARAIP